MFKIFLVAFMSCDWILGTWYQVYKAEDLNPISTTTPLVDTIVFTKEGILQRSTPWNTISGAWYINAKCDSLVVFPDKTAPKLVQYQSRIYLSGDTLIIQNQGRESIYNEYYIKVYEK